VEFIYPGLLRNCQYVWESKISTLLEAFTISLNPYNYKKKSQKLMKAIDLTKAALRRLIN